MLCRPQPVCQYYRLPPCICAFTCFCTRYFLKLGFLDGVPGWKWYFSVLASLCVFAFPRVANCRKGVYDKCFGIGGWWIWI